MSDEYVQEEEYVEAPLSAEELLEQHKAEIEARFEEKGFFARLGSMFSGLSKPRDSREYKEARLELARLKAPIIGLLLPIVGVTVVVILTSVTGGGEKKEFFEVSTIQEEAEELQEEEPEPEVEPPDPPEEMPDIQVDTPTVGPVTDMVTPNTPVSAEPVSVKPAAQDSVAIIKSPVTMRTMTGSRTPGSIGAMTRGGAGYGDPSTEAAVLKALRWLKYKQQPSGNWEGPISNTGLAILTFLAHGETPASKEFGETVEKAINYLVINQVERNGLVTFNGVDGNEYATLICTYALGEAYGMTKNPDAKEAALKSMSRIIQNQSPTGGWDYKMNKTSTRDDMSYAGWALQALKACKMAGLHPEGLDACIKKAMHCLETRNFKNGGFNYTAGGGPTGLTATGCLCMQLLGYGDRKEVTAALETMRAWLPAFEGTKGVALNAALPGPCAQYYSYYAAQCKYQAGMKEGALQNDVKTWQDWNAAMKKLYPPSIITLDEEIEGPDGKSHKMGYWKKADAHGAGDVMSTCLTALQLMVYYRYLPTTQTKAGKSDSEEPVKKKKKKTDDVAVEVDI